MQTAPTPLDHMNAIVSLDIPEMDKIAQVNFDRFYLKRSLECALLCCKARRKQLEHEISVEINMRQNQGGFSSVLKTFVSAHVMIT